MIADKKKYDSLRIGRLASMGINPLESGKLYWWQELSIMREYNNQIKLKAGRW